MPFQLSSRLLQTIAVVSTVGAGISTPDEAQAYDIDCAVMLCLPGGFPAGCAAAKVYAFKRMKKGKPPFGHCDGYEGPSPYFQRQQIIHCKAPKIAFTTCHGSRPDGYCATSTYTRQGRDGPETIYTGVTAAKSTSYLFNINVDGTTHQYAGDWNGSVSILSTSGFSGQNVLHVSSNTCRYQDGK